MNLYMATATGDWGHIYFNRQVEASNFGTAFARAGRMAQKESRKRPAKISVTVTRVCSKGKAAPGVVGTA